MAMLNNQMVNGNNHNQLRIIFQKIHGFPITVQ
jgi:hypothetical protein